MNVFRLVGDISRLLNIVVLLLSIWTKKSCAGISLKTRELYVVLYLARYLDLLTIYISLYNTVMKLALIGTSVCVVLYMRFHEDVKQTYNKDEDRIRHYFLIPPCFLLAPLVNQYFIVMEVSWTFSHYLEAVAILPQLILLHRTKNIDNLTGTYVFILGAERASYLLYWMYQFFVEKRRVLWIPRLSGSVQTALYVVFLYYYIKSWKSNKELELPLTSTLADNEELELPLTSTLADNDKHELPLTSTLADNDKHELPLTSNLAR